MSELERSPPALAVGPAALFVLPALGEGGGARLVFGLAGALNRLGSRAEVFSTGPAVDATLDPTAVTGTVLFGVSSEGRIRHQLPGFLRRLRDAARRADIIVSGVEIGAGLDIAVLAGLLAWRPVLVIVHSNLAYTMSQTIGRHRHFARWAYPRLSGAVLPSRELAPTLTAVAQKLPRRVRWIPSGIDIEAVGSAARRDADVPLPPAPLVVAVGRLVPEKGLDLLIRAHAAALGRGRPHALMLLGEGPERGALQALIRALGVERSVVLAGHCTNPHAIVARASLFCFPSRYEGMGLALLEALAVGAPIVAADCVAGPAQVLDRGAYGDLVPAESAPALTEAIVRHLDDPDRLRAKAAAGKAWAASFTLDRSARGYQAFFREVLGQARPRPIGCSTPMVTTAG
jgi:glycosyltransferase involved in cell wall biosynthesis